MRPEASAVPASPLTVWVGPTRYVFPPGRDVVVGYGAGADIPLQQLGNAGLPPQAPRPEVLLRVLGTHWLAIDTSRSGILSNGFRAPAVRRHDRQAMPLGAPLSRPQPGRLHAPAVRAAGAADAQP